MCSGMTRTLAVQIWSDVACPWCYVGKRRFDAALAKFPQRDSVQVTWKAFELDRNAPTVYPSSPNYAERLATKYRLPVVRAIQMIDEMATRGAQEGIHFDFAKVRGVNTFIAHQLSALAGQQSDSALQHALAERLFRAYFSEGRLLSDPEVLIELGAEVGMSPELVRASLDGQSFAELARAEEHEAAEMGVSGVPFFLIGRYAVEGAQPPDLLLRVLNQAWNETVSTGETDFQEGAVCGPDGC